MKNVLQNSIGDDVDKLAWKQMKTVQNSPFKNQSWIRLITRQLSVRRVFGFTLIEFGICVFLLWMIVPKVKSLDGSATEAFNEIAADINTADQAVSVKTQ